MISACRIFVLQAREKGVNLVLDISPPSTSDTETKVETLNYKEALYYLTDQDHINVDEHKMQQVIRNLVSNAIKFTASGSNVTIRVRKTLPSFLDSIPHSYLFDSNQELDSDEEKKFKHAGRILNNRI